MWGINYLRVENPNDFNDLIRGPSIVELFPEKEQSIQFWNSYNN